MQFASDNSGPVHPKIMEALSRTNSGHVGSYGADDETARAVALIREAFEAPDAGVWFVPTGTAANSLALAALTMPFDTVFCADVAHIHEDECNAPEFYTGGAKLTLVESEHGRISAEALDAAIAGEGTRGVHGPQRGPVSITQITERGTAYGLADIGAIADVTHGYGLKLHMDGARFANALDRLGCSPAEMSWKAGVDILSFGATKNGAMGVEAVVAFDPDIATTLELRRKRAGQLLSKHRYLAAQMVGYLENDLWRDLGARANAAAARLVAGLEEIDGVSFVHPCEGNAIFASWPAHAHAALFDKGAAYHLWGDTLEGAAPDQPLAARLVCDWSIEDAQIDAFLATLEDALKA